MQVKLFAALATLTIVFGAQAVATASARPMVPVRSREDGYGSIRRAPEALAA